MLPAQTAEQLVLEGVGVDFGVTRALNGVSLSVKPGEIIGLIGHNGAGKSTLFNVVSGALTPTEGSISVGGVPVSGRPRPRDMARLGVTVIHQEPALAKNLSVLDNLFLGQEDLVHRGHRLEQAKAAMATVGADIALTRRVSTLGLGERQLVDLARGMVRGKIRVLMLDEPTAALGRAETDTLHRLIRELAEDGVAVIYVSHRLPDILDVCERIVILNGGSVQSDGPASEHDGPSLARALAPDTHRPVFTRVPQHEQRVALRGVFDGISAKRGEIVGLFGMAAGRQFELLESLFGETGKYRYELDAQVVAMGSPSDAVAHGVHLVPADRENDGLVSGRSALDTVFTPWYGSEPGRGRWIRHDAGQQTYREARETLHIIGPGAAAPIDEFSGGNRQKHLIARWAFVQRPRLLLLAQPTQGVDIGARNDIARAIDAIAEQGTTVLVASSESDEIDLLCDRAYVIVDTRFSHVERTGQFSEALLAELLELAENPERNTRE